MTTEYNIIIWCITDLSLCRRVGLCGRIVVSQQRRIMPTTQQQQNHHGVTRKKLGI